MFTDEELQIIQMMLIDKLERLKLKFEVEKTLEITNEIETYKKIIDKVMDLQEKN